MIKVTVATRAKPQDWARFVREGLVEGDGERSTVLPFDKMSKKFGAAYVDWLHVCWAVNQVATGGGKEPHLGLTDAEFAYHHGGVPEPFMARLRRAEWAVRE